MIGAVLGIADWVACYFRGSTGEDSRAVPFGQKDGLMLKLLTPARDGKMKTLVVLTRHESVSSLAALSFPTMTDRTLVGLEGAGCCYSALGFVAVAFPERTLPG